MEVLGLHVTATPHAGSAPLDVLPGRMQRRWYLVPPRPRAVRVASLALVQPLRPGPRILKRFAAGAARLGVPHLWRHACVHVSGPNRIAPVFGPNATHAAFLTGTAGPHRKLVVQFMGGHGSIGGYAKVACKPAAQALLANEASVLAELRDVGLRSAVVPRRLLQEFGEGAAVLATDTARTQRSTCCARLRPSHLAFLDELATRTASRAPDGGALLDGLRAKVRDLPQSLSAEWRHRFEHALELLALAPELVAPRGLAHGDFTPGNTFQHRDRLCVFDWEYAGYDYPADFDLIRFVFTVQALRHEATVACCRAVESVLVRELGRSARAARARLIAYLCAQALMLAGRRSGEKVAALTWEGEQATSLMLDALSGQGRMPA